MRNLGKSSSSSDLASQGDILRGPQAFTRGPKILLPFYIYPSNAYTNPQYNQLIEEARNHPEVQFNIVLNNSNGPGGARDLNYVVAIKRLRACSNVRILGYVDTNFGNRSASLVRTDIDLWRSWYQPDGIFLDQMDTSTNMIRVQAVRNLTDYIHNSDIHLSIGNPGTDVPAVHLENRTADVFVVYENSGTPGESFLRGDFEGGHADYSTDVFAAILHSQPSFSVSTAKLLSKYLGMWSFNSTVGYSAIPPYFTEMLDWMTANIIPSISSTIYSKDEIDAKFSTQTFASLVNKPTTLAGYGIVDSYTTSAVQSRGMNLVTNGTGLMGYNYNFSSFEYYLQDVFAGSASFLTTEGLTTKILDEMIPVNPSKYYRADVAAKSVNHVDGANFAYGFSISYDIDSLSISPWHYTYAEASFTYLTQPLSVGDTVIHVQNASGWTGHAHNWVKIHSYTNGKGYTWGPRTYSRNTHHRYSGGPANRPFDTYSDSDVDKVNNQITLLSPWGTGADNAQLQGKTWPIGTPISVCYPAGSYQYFLMGNQKIPNTWTSYSGVIGGLQGNGDAASTKFPYGTAFIRLGFLLNGGNGFTLDSQGRSGNTTALSALSFSEITPENLTGGLPGLTGSFQSADIVSVTNGIITGKTEVVPPWSPLISPSFTGTPTAPTPSPADNTTKIATSAFVANAIATLNTALTGNIDSRAPLASPALTGVPTAPTAAVSTNTTQLATTAFVKLVDSAQTTATNTLLAAKAPLASPTFTGIPAAPTAVAGTNTTQLATTAFVTAGLSLKANLSGPAFTGIPTAPTAAAGTNTTQLATTSFVTAAAALKANLSGAVFTGSVVLNGGATVINTASGDSSTKVANTAFVTSALATLSNSAAAAYVPKSDFSPNAILPQDLRSVTPDMISVPTKRFARFRFGQMNESGAPYADIIDLNTYSDSSGGAVNSLYFNKSVQRIVHKFGVYGSTVWNSRDLAYLDEVLNGPAFTGTPTVPTAAKGTSTTQIASTAFVAEALTSVATVPRGSGGTVGRWVSRTGPGVVFTDLTPTSPLTNFSPTKFAFMGLTGPIYPGSSGRVTGLGLVADRMYRMGASGVPELVPEPRPEGYPDSSLMNENTKYLEGLYTYSDGAEMWASLDPSALVMVPPSEPVVVIPPGEKLDLTAIAYNTNLIGGAVRNFGSLAAGNTTVTLLADGDAGQASGMSPSTVMRNFPPSKGVFLQERQYGQGGFRYNADTPIRLGGGAQFRWQAELDNWDLIVPGIFIGASGTPATSAVAHEILLLGNPGSNIYIKKVTWTNGTAVEGPSLTGASGVASGITRSAKTWYRIKVKVVEATKAVSVKFWREVDAEPAAWQIDSLVIADLQAGYMGWRTKDGVFEWNLIETIPEAGVFSD